jgi:hypothetical protein
MEDSNFSYHQTDFNLRNIEPSSHLQCHKADQDWTCEDSHVGSLHLDMTLGDYSAFSGLPQDYSNLGSRTYGDARDSSEQLLQGHDISALEDDVLSYSLSPSVSPLPVIPLKGGQGVETKGKFADISAV